MVRKTYYIIEDQDLKLKLRAKKEGVSVSELVRRGLDAILANPRNEEVRRNALLAVGVFSSGDTDVSVRHDEYLTDYYANKHSC